MTYRIPEKNSADIAESFLHSTWPVDAKIDSWQDYSVLANSADVLDKLAVEFRRAIDAES